MTRVSGQHLPNYFPPEGKRRHLTPFEPAMQGGAWHVRGHELSRYDEKIVHTEMPELTSRDQRLLQRELGQAIVTGMRSVIDIVAVTPAQYGHRGDVSGQLAIRDSGGHYLDLGTHLQCRRRLFMPLDVHKTALG